MNINSNVSPTSANSRDHDLVPRVVTSQEFQVIVTAMKRFHHVPAPVAQAHDWFIASDGTDAHVIADISEDRGSRRVVDLDIVAANDEHSAT